MGPRRRALSFKTSTAKRRDDENDDETTKASSKDDVDVGDENGGGGSRVETLSAKAVRRGFKDKTLQRTYDEKYVYHGRKRVYQGEDEDASHNTSKFPFTAKNALNFEGTRADVNEIAPGENRLTQFNAALIATKILAGHIASRG